MAFGLFSKSKQSQIGNLMSPKCYLIPLWYGVVIRHCSFFAKLVEVTAWCHEAPSHYLKQCWFATNHINMFEKNPYHDSRFPMASELSVLTKQCSRQEIFPLMISTMCHCGVPTHYFLFRELRFCLQYFLIAYQLSMEGFFYLKCNRSALIKLKNFLIWLFISFYP